MDHLEILDGEDVVRRLEQARRGAAEPFQGALARRGKGEGRIPLDLREDGRGRLRLEQLAGQEIEILETLRLDPEAEDTRAEGGEQRDRAAGKALRRAQRPGQRQLENHVRSATAGRLGAYIF